MLLDVNVLLYAVDRSSPDHARARDWLSAALTGSTRVGLPWQTIGGFLRIATHPRVFDQPLTTSQAWTAVDGWLASPVAWVPPTSERTVDILRTWMLQARTSGARTTDAQLAALAIEHGVPVVSTDADFAGFPGVAWINPLTPTGR
ncbi:TA system VapC family ribonuclease toxin [Mariniluteicoccus flavus]